MVVADRRINFWSVSLWLTIGAASGQGRFIFITKSYK